MSGFDGEKSCVCTYCARRYVYRDSLARHLAVCATRLRAIIRTLVNCPKHRDLKPSKCCRGVLLGDEVLREDGQGR